MGPPVWTDAGGPLWFHRLLLGCCLRHRKYGDEHAAFSFGIELHATVGESEQCVILANAYVTAGMPLGPALARQNVAGYDAFAAELLDAKALAVRVPAVARR